MTGPTQQQLYEQAQQFRKLAFVERPYFGSPGAPAQAETNTSGLWGHLNGGMLIGYEYTRWWHECRAMRETAVLGDWSWLNKVRVTGPDAARLMNYASVKDVAGQALDQVLFTPMAAENGKVAIEGLTFRFAENEFMFSQSGAQMWLPHIRDKMGFDATIEDVTPDLTVFAVQGPRATEVVEAVTGEDLRDLKFSRWRWIELLGERVILDRQGVTGEIGYELLMPTARGRAHELWRRIREVGEGVGLRELGFKAFMVGHAETGIATAVRDYLPARMPADKLARFARLWTSAEELAALDYDLTEHWCSPAELGWARTIDLDREDFHGRAALAAEAERGGPARRLVGLAWNADDLAQLYGRIFRGEPSAPPFDLPYGQFRMQFLKVLKDGGQVGWASGSAYSANLGRMISLARLARDLAAGDEVSVLWGGFTSEPAHEIRAEVSELPFIRQRRRDDPGETPAKT
jgi:glycine cleavage system T protein (aminomethyltransferase)